jgi:single-strand DNA-binding protein
MGSVNKVTLVGRLGKDPEMRFTASGQGVCSFTMATDSRWTDKAGVKQEKTEWHRVKAWGRTGEIAAQFLKKGSEVYIEGRIETKEYTDKDGVRKWSTEIVANELVLLGSKPRDEGHASVTHTEEPQSDIPF